MQANIPEMSILYLNQAYEVKKGTYYGDFFIIGQILPRLKPPENLSDYKFKSTLTQVVFFRSDRKTFLDYGYSIDNDKTLYSTSKKKIPTSFSGTIL